MQIADIYYGKMDKKAQVFVSDLVIAVILMTMIIIIYFTFNVNQNIDDEYRGKNLISEAKTISDYLVRSGLPEDWNKTNVVRIGLTDGDHVLDKQKLADFSNLTKTDYDDTRESLKTKYDYIVFFRGLDGAIINVSGDKFFGKSGVNNTNIDLQEPAFLTRISRYMVLKNEDVNVTSAIIEMVIYVWSK